MGFGKISLEFIFNSGEIIINYFKRQNRLKPIGHMHINNEEIIDMINEINREDKVVRITATFFGSSFQIIEKATKRKKSWFLIRRYYSC